MKFGARMLKTGIAVSLAFWICIWLQLTPAVIAAIAAVLSLQPSIFRSWQHFIEQIQANLIGAIVGITFTMMFGHSPIIIGLAIIIVIGINLQLKFDKAIGLSIVTVIIIMENPTTQYLLFAGNRFLLIIIGILSSLLVNAIFLPPKYEHKLFENIMKNYEQLSLLLRFRLNNEFTERSYRKEEKNANDLLQQILELNRLYQEEKRYARKKRYQTTKKMVVFTQMIECNQQARNVLKNLEKLSPHKQKLPAELRDLLAKQLDCLILYHERILHRYKGTFRAKSGKPLVGDCDEGNFQLMGIMHKDFPAIPKEIQMITASVVGELLEYSSELLHLEKLVRRSIDMKKAL